MTLRRIMQMFLECSKRELNDKDYQMLKRYRGLTRGQVNRLDSFELEQEMELTREAYRQIIEG